MSALAGAVVVEPEEGSVAQAAEAAQESIDLANSLEAEVAAKVPAVVAVAHPCL